MTLPSMPELSQLITHSKNSNDSPYHCLHHDFEQQVLLYPDAIALVFKESHLSYHELNQRANKLAHYLQTLGVGPEILVAISVERSMDFIIGMLAVLKAGGAYLPLDPENPVERLEFMLTDTDVTLLITQHHLIQSCFSNCAVQTICLDTDWEIIEPFSHANPLTTVTADNLLYVIYTSGSTGQPKGVMVTHRNVTRLFTSTRKWFHFNENDRWTLFHSYAFGYSVWEMWGALLHGGRLVIVPQQAMHSATEFYTLLQQQQISVVCQTPSAFRQLLLTDSFLNISSLFLRFIIFSGEAIVPQDVDIWFARHGDQQPQLVNMYAITETGGQIAYRLLTQKILDESTSTRLIGDSLPDMTVYILDANYQEVEVGLSGELYVAGEGVSRGYFKQAELTAQKFVANPFSSHSKGCLYKTGDIARRLLNGSIELLGRADTQVKIRGFRIELSELETVLRNHPQINAVTSMVREDQPGEKRLVAYLVTMDQQVSISISQLRGYLDKHLPNHMRPNAFVFMEHLPLTLNGKINKSALPMPNHQRPNLAEVYQAPVTPLEKELTTLWQNILQLDSIGLHDNFFELGGDSILMVSLLNRIEVDLHHTISMSAFFDSPTIAGLEAAINQVLSEQSTDAAIEMQLDELENMSEQDAQRLLAKHMLTNTADTTVHESINADHETFMRVAIEQAIIALQSDQVPIGACIVKKGEVIASTSNRVWKNTDITAHAEMEVIRAACKQLNTINLSDCILYTTCEPCAMCFNAAHWANLPTIVYAMDMEDANKLGFNAITLSAAEMKQQLESPMQLVKQLRQETLEIFLSNSNEDSRSEYDAIAEQYQGHLDLSPVLLHVESYLFWSMLGNIKGKSVLDLACGEGRYTRQLIKKGASRAIGVDISEKMIRLAQTQEDQDPLGIDYYCSDASQIENYGQFDQVTAAYLLHYARSKEELLAMCKNIAGHLKKGGRFISISDNMMLSPEHFHLLERYGIIRTVAGQLQDGVIINNTLFSIDNSDSVNFNTYHFSQETYEWALRLAGFQRIQWHQPTVSAAGLAEYGAVFWQVFLDNPSFIGLECHI